MLENLYIYVFIKIIGIKVVPGGVQNSAKILGSHLGTKYIYF